MSQSKSIVQDRIDEPSFLDRSKPPSHASQVHADPMVVPNGMPAQHTPVSGHGLGKGTELPPLSTRDVRP